MVVSSKPHIGAVVRFVTTTCAGRYDMACTNAELNAGTMGHVFCLRCGGSAQIKQHFGRDTVVRCESCDTPLAVIDCAGPDACGHE